MLTSALSSKIDPLLRLILTHLNSEITWFSSGSFLYVNLIFYTVNWPVKRISWTEVQHPDPLPDYSIQYLWLCCLKQYHNPREAPLILVLVLLLKDSSTIHTFHPGTALRWQSPLGIRFRYKYSRRYHMGFVHWLPIFSNSRNSSFVMVISFLYCFNCSCRNPLCSAGTFFLNLISAS